MAQFTNYISDFNANKDGPQDVVPLVEDNTKTFQNLKKIHTDTVTLRNTSGGTLFWRYIVEDVEMENMVRSAGKYKVDLIKMITVANEYIHSLLSNPELVN